jgi:predicted phosphate transport protein (TIGR00153 family)
MKESRNILGWLGMKQEELVLEDAKKHVDVTYDTVDWFKKGILAYINGDEKSKKEAIIKVRECERHADELRSKMVDKLSEGILIPPDREDLMHFVKSLDRIADWTNGAARLLDFITEKLAPPILKELSAATDILVNSVTKLKDGIHSVMANDLDRAIDDCNEVERYETKADDQKKVLIEAIIKTKMDAPMLLLSYQLAEYMEGVTDKIEDAADFIKVIAIKSK